MLIISLESKEVKLKFKVRIRSLVLREGISLPFGNIS